MPSAKRAASGRAALGFRVHSGWAAAVAVAGTPARSEILERRRIDVADPAIRGSVQPYHAAEPMPVEEARRYLDRCAAASARLAAKAVADLVGAVRSKGYEVAAAAARFRATEAELMRQVTEAGKAVGAPWRADEKLAALVAWLALSQR